MTEFSSAALATPLSTSLPLDRCRLALLAAQEGVWDWNVQTGQIECDALWFQMLDYSTDEFPMSLERWQWLVHPEDAPLAMAAIFEQIEKGGTFDISYRMRTAREEWRWMQARGRVVSWDGSDPLRIVGTQSDITQRKQIEHALRASDERVRTLLASMQELVFTLNSWGQIVEYHPPAYQAEQYPHPSTVLDKNYSDVFPAEISAQFDESIGLLLGEDTTHAFEYTLTQPLPGTTDSTLWEAPRIYAVSVSRLVGISDFPDGFLVMVRDVTTLRHSEEALRVAATAFESQEGMLVTDPQQIILRVNRAFTYITGYHAEEAIGKTPALLKSGEHDDEFYQEMHKALHQQGFWQGEIWNRRKTGELYLEWITITAVKDAHNKVTHYVGAFSDVTRHKEAETQMRSMAYYDPLTQLPNRRLCLERLTQALGNSSRTHHHGVLVMLDVDHLKRINDTLGHDAGDALLCGLAQRLEALSGPHSTVARFGSDEFVVLLEQLGQDPQLAQSRAELRVQQLHQQLTEPFMLEGLSEPVACTVSMGACCFLSHDLSIEEVVRRADAAMYQAREGGLNQYRFFDPEMQAMLNARALFAYELSRVLEHQQLELHYQMQVDTEGQILGAEALLRWNHPERGVLSAAEFIGLAEENGLIIPIGRWVLEQACRQLKRWENQPQTAALHLAVNISPSHFEEAGFVDEVVHPE